MVSSPKAVGECDLVYFPKVHRCHRNGARHGDAIKQEELCEALRCYTHNRAYRLRLIAGATRIDLNGQPAGFVTKKQEAAAKKAVKPSAPKASAQRGTSDADKSNVSCRFARSSTSPSWCKRVSALTPWSRDSRCRDE
jgi:sRNA-binding protein